MLSLLDITLTILTRYQTCSDAAGESQEPAVFQARVQALMIHKEGISLQNLQDFCCYPQCGRRTKTWSHVYVAVIPNRGSIDQNMRELLQLLYGAMTPVWSVGSASYPTTPLIGAWVIPQIAVHRNRLFDVSVVALKRAVLACPTGFKSHSLRLRVAGRKWTTNPFISD